MANCQLCTGDTTTGHEATCQATWKNPKWVNREQVWSHRAQCWVWREFKAVVAAKSIYRALEVEVEEIDLDISPQEVEEALAY
jgi:hypothetical protein